MARPDMFPPPPAVRIIAGRLPDRISYRIEVAESGCWLWTGCLTPNGYGVVRPATGNKRQAYTHRCVYEALVGPIPEGLTLDHLCRVRACCNPEHLEPTTLAENVHRGVQARDHCRNGHFQDWRTTANGERRCRQCETAAKRRARRMERAA